MPVSEAFTGVALDVLRQSPLLAVTVLVAWYDTRQLSRQHDRELAAKEQEIARLLEEKTNEIERLLEERRKHFQLFLKEIQPRAKRNEE